MNFMNKSCSFKSVGQGKSTPLHDLTKTDGQILTSCEMGLIRTNEDQLSSVFSIIIFGEGEKKKNC